MSSWADLHRKRGVSTLLLVLAVLGFFLLSGAVAYHFLEKRHRSSNIKPAGSATPRATETAAAVSSASKQDLSGDWIDENNYPANIHVRRETLTVHYEDQDRDFTHYDDGYRFDSDADKSFYILLTPEPDGRLKWFTYTNGETTTRFLKRK